MSHYPHKVVVVSGVTRGLGRAMVEEFIGQGHTVAGCGRSAEGIHELKKTHPAQHWDRVDVTDDKEVRHWAERVMKKVGTPDYLINNAALINRSAPLWELSSEEFGDVVDVNIKGVFHLLRHFIPGMISRNKGVVINFSSGWGRSTAPEVATYCATKYAMEGLTQALAQELPSGMAAIPLNPGIIDTEMLRSCFGGSAQSYPKPKEWAKKAVPFILGLSAKHNGQSLTVPS